MQITNLIKKNVTKNVIESIDIPKLIDVVEVFSEKQFGSFKNDFMFSLQGLMVDLIKEISTRRKK